MKILRAHGITRVPAVIVGDRAVHGWNPAAVAGLVGATYDDGLVLPLEELKARLDKILLAAQSVVIQVPAQHMHMRTPGRDRSVHQLAYHLFRVGQSYRDAMEQGYLPEAWPTWQPLPVMESVWEKDCATGARGSRRSRERWRHTTAHSLLRRSSSEPCGTPHNTCGSFTHSLSRWA